MEVVAAAGMVITHQSEMQMAIKLLKNYVRGVNREIVVNTIDITHLDSLYIGMVYVRTQVGHIVSFATLDDYIVFYIPLNTS